MASSDFPRPCIIGYGSSPSRCGPPYARANSQPTARRGISQVPTRTSEEHSSELQSRGHRAWRHVLAHVAFDHNDSLRSREFIISWLNHTPHATAVYASCSALPPPHATLASRRLARPYLGRTCTG